ncbi:MAG: HAMP domain-containing histidine kinase, partial [Bacteroidales bacterium]
GEKMIISNIYNSLSNYYLQIGIPENAYSYRKLCSQLQDSLSSALLEERLVKLQVQYDIENKDQELQYLRQNEEIEELQIQKDRYFRNFMFIFVSILVAATLGSMYTLWQKKKSTSILEKQKQLQEETNLQLLNAKKTQQEINLTKNKFLAIISNDLISPFTSLLEFTEELEKRSASFNRRDVKKYSGIIYQSSRNLHQMLENLLQWSRNQRGKIDYHPEYFDLNRMINNLTSFMEIAAHRKNIEITLDLHKAIIAFADENHVDTIIRNLLNNAIKFTQINGLIKISSREKNDFIEVSVKDNGIGITREDMDKLFRLDTHVTRRGTANEMGTGLGLIIVKELVKKNGGDIYVESKVGEGSNFVFTLPKKP